MRLRLFILLSFLLTIPFVYAIEDSVTSKENTNLDTLLNNITSINSYLQNNEVLIPPSVEKIITNGNLSVNISEDEGSVESLYITIDEKRITEISRKMPSKSVYDLFIDEETLNNIISSKSISDSLLAYYNEGKIRIEANGFGNNIKLFFAKIFLKFI